MGELETTVAAAAAGLRRLGVGRGDRVAAIVPNIPEAVVGLLATASLGAIWSSCSPEFGTQSIVDRLAQIEPTVLIAVDGYAYGGGRSIGAASSTSCPGGPARPRADDHRPGRTWTAIAARHRRPGDRSPGPTSGRSGRAAHVRARPVRPSALDPLLLGHDRAAQGDRPWPRRRRPRARQGGRPASRRPPWRPAVLVHDDRLDDVELPGRRAARRRRPGPLRRQPRLPGPGRAVGARRAGRAHLLGGERRVPHGLRKAGLRPARTTTCRPALHRLDRVAAAGRRLPVGLRRGRPTSGWRRSAAGPMSSRAFVGGCPIAAGPRGRAAVPQPRRAGRGVRRGRALGRRRDRRARPDRADAVDAGGVLERPRWRALPRELLRDVSRASGATATGSGSRARASAVIEGRSDSTLNREGIRFGTSELYGVVDAIPEVVDSLVIGLERPDGGYWMPLFVVLVPAATLDDALASRIRPRSGRAVAAPRPGRDRHGAGRSRGR